MLFDRPRSAVYKTDDPTVVVVSGGGGGDPDPEPQPDPVAVDTHAEVAALRASHEAMGAEVRELRASVEAHGVLHGEHAGKLDRIIAAVEHEPEPAPVVTLPEPDPEPVPEPAIVDDPVPEVVVEERWPHSVFKTIL